MKIYTIIVTVIAILALIGGIYFYTQYSSMSKQYAGLEEYRQEKAEAERQLGEAQEQLLRISTINTVLTQVLDSFIIPGDLKALSIGSGEAIKVEQEINKVADSKDRMILEKDWNDFKNSRLLNSLFHLLQDVAGNIERTMAPKI